MKYYGFSNEKNYICRYEVKNDEIILHFADGKIGKIPYSIGAEQSVISLMEHQVNNISQNDIDQMNLELGRKKRNLFFSIIMLALLDLITAFGMSYDSMILLYSAIIQSPCLIIALSFVYSTSKYSKLLEDLKKNKIYLDNQDSLDRSNELETSNLNINTIDKIPYKEVINMVEKVSYEEFDKPLTRERKI